MAAVHNATDNSGKGWSPTLRAKNKSKVESKGFKSPKPAGTKGVIGATSWEELGEGEEGSPAHDF